MEFTADMIASFLGGTIEGNKEVAVSTVSKIEEAESGSLAFLSNPKYESYIYLTKASIVIVNNDFIPQADVKATLIKVEDAYSSFAKLLELYAAHKGLRSGISSICSIDKSVIIPEDAYIGDYSVIESGVTLGNNIQIFPQVYIGRGVKIGSNVTLHPGVRIYDDCVLGDNIIIHSGVVIGADGFGFAPMPDGAYKKIPQIGNVIIEDDVEIGSNTCIDRATMGSTVVKKGVKLDNLIQLGHNTRVDSNTVIAAQTGVAGSSKIGKSCIIAGQVGIAGHLSIASNTIIASQSGIASSIKTKGQTVMGYPAYNARDFQRSHIFSKSLPDMNRKLNELTKELASIKQQLKDQSDK